ncbi:MAG: hypothetical protein Q8Q94_02340 [bacterium]|nr:hypothetical protein [bacterium]
MFTIKEHGIIIAFFLLISAVIGTIAVFLYLSPTNCDGIGCIALLPYAIPTLPTYPAVALINFLTIGPASGILRSPTLLKFIPIFLIFVNSFIFGLLCTTVFISFRKRFDGEKLNRTKYAAKKFLPYFFVWVVIFSIFIAVKYPLKPFLSDEEILSACTARRYTNTNKCLINYVVYKLPTDLPHLD